MTDLLAKKRAVVAALLEQHLAGFTATDIAVVGLAGRYPGAATLDEFWDVLRSGRAEIRDLPPERFDARRWYDPEPGKEGRLYTARGGFIADADKFDPLFFGISPREAEGMDPQERVFLEVAWAALEDAGHPPSALERSRVGVFVGAMNSGYGSLGATAWARGVPTGARTTFWSIANRLSYVCNFRGPSLCVDTACSASLTAIHLACESLRRGECDVAVAGGVNLVVHPLQLIGLCSLTMLSPTGRCSAFGAAADGFVDGEGAGAVFLKPLAAAVADRDHVWGVLRGSALNAGGKTAGYTVPNPHEQAACVRDALARARVDPRTISYIEAHGTGTALGDPIEVAALNRVFGAADVPTRAIGTVKANVGHLESAAGVCGLTRVLLQIRHATLAPSIHSDPPNPRIPFDRSTLRVPRRAEPWLRPHVDGREVPLRAGLSSFGAGGANAHMIIEELRDPLAALEPPARPPFLLVLSARDDERRTALARVFAEFLRAPHQEPVDPARLCRTLQVGREAMTSRLAVVFSDLAAVPAALDAFLAGEPHPDVFHGHSKRDRPRLAALAAPPPLRQGLDAAALAQWAERWTAGDDVAWPDLHGPVPPRRMSLPTYPFARESYWVDPRALDFGPNLLQPVPGDSQDSPGATAQPVPQDSHDPPASASARPVPEDSHAPPAAPRTIQLVLTADDVRLRDHHVRGRPVLPGAALADLVLTAGASDALHDLELLSPLTPDGDRLALTLRFHDAAVEVFANSRDEAPAARARLAPPTTTSEPPRVDLDALRRRCPEPLAVDYAALARAGIVHGPAFRLLTHAWRGDGECLAHLGADVPAIWPALLDAAFQAVAPLTGPFQARHRMLLPHGLARLRRAAAPRLPAWVHVRQASPDEPRFDLRLFDAAGRTLAEIDDFRLHPVAHRLGEHDPGEASTTERDLRHPDTRIDHAALRPPAELLLLDLAWTPQPARPDPDRHRRALLFTADDALAAALAARHPAIAWQRIVPGDAFVRHPAHITLDPTRPDQLRALVETLDAEAGLPDLVLDGLADLYDASDPGIPPHTAFLFHLLQRLRPHDRPTRLLSWSRRSPPEHLALSAMFLTIQQEWPAFAGRVLALADHAAAPGELATLLADEWQDRDPHPQIVFRDGRRHAPRLEPVPIPTPAPVPTGTWLISGGLGGLGLVLARHLARPGATLVLAGRAPIGPATEARLQPLRDAGAHVLHHPCDVTRMPEVRALVDACAALGPLRGVIHAAGVTRDARLTDKQDAAFAEVLAVKRLGALHLDRATADVPLECFVVCSSMAGLLGNAGQVDYAYANACLDHLAEQREALRRRGLRSGRTRTIRWPPLVDGGMALDPAGLEWLRHRFGLVPLDAAGCIAAFEAALHGETTGLLPVAGAVDRLRRTLFAPAEPAPTDSLPAPDDRPRRLAAARKLLTSLIVDTLRLPPSRLDPHQPLDTYGLDSVSAMALARALETHVGKVPRTLFLELPTLAALADHLADHHAFPAETSAPPPPPALADEPARTPPVPGDSPQPSTASPTPTALADLTTTPHAPGAAPRTELPLPTISDDRIAIIGMAGRFPGSPDLETYADDLREGRSRITDLPAARRDDPGGPPRLGGWLADVDRFDHALFQIPHLEATAMDPAERLFLEIAWETLEHAGYPRSRRAASQRRSGLGTGVFVGCMYRQYAHLARDPETRGLLSNGSYWAIANRVSWFFDLQGPSLALDNACAAGLSAVHQACLALRAGECAMALAGAVNLSLHPHKHKGLALAGLLSGSPTPRLFGEGDGFLPGEGVAAVLLKPLARAVADGDRVLAVVRATRLGHGGKTAGLSVPATLAQADLVAGTLARAGLGPRDLDYLELAANGSAIGDAVELRALARALAGAPPGSIPVGSTKASLGHLEAASGLAQLIKVVLQLRRRELFPSLPTTHPPVRLPDGIPLRLVPAPVAWPARRAGIHAFGAGGSEAFLLLESHAPPDPLPATAAPAPKDSPAVPLAPPAPKDSPAAGFIAPLAPPAPKDSPHLFLFSAATPDRLRAWIARLADHLARHAPTPADLAYTLQIARERLPHRLAVVADDLRELRDLLALWQSGATDPRLCTGETDAADLLLDGPEGEAFLRVALANRRLDKLARAWVRGVEADGSALHPGRPRLVDLPPYPFTPTVCWLREPPPPAQTPPSLAATSHASVQATIRDLLADLLRCDPAALDPHRELHDLGLTSMLATSLVLGLRDRLRVDLPLAALRDAPTIEALARRLATTTPPITDPLPPELLRLQRGEGALPSFWVHGAPGFAEVFAGLPALLGPDRSIYAFRARGLDGARPPFHDIGAMTDHYVDALLHARPTGPILLGGYSLGGLIAHAMAHRLRDRGVAVAALVLFDTYPVGDGDPADADADADTDTKKSGPKGREDKWKRMIADMFLTSGHLPETALDGVPEALHASRLAALLADRPTILPADRLYPALCGAFAVSAHHSEALRRYRPPRLVGVPALYVRAARGLDGRPDRPEDRARRTDFWQQRIAEVVRIVDLDADHHGLLASDHHPALRAALAAVLPGAACP